MTLLALLCAIQEEWPSRLHPLHINHQLRATSGDDARWLTRYVREQFSQDLRVIPVVVDRAKRESVEMAARRVRYMAFRQYAAELGAASLVLVAHQKDDQAETVLMRLITGTGVLGLSAMRSRNRSLVRPLLAFSRAQLRMYLERHHVKWLEDPSNADPAMLRNKIRHEIIPGLEAVNPLVRDALAGLAARAGEHNQAFQFLLQDWLARQDIHENGNELLLGPGWTSWPLEITTMVLREFAQRHDIRLSRRHLAAVGHGLVLWPLGYRVEPLPGGGLRVGRSLTSSPVPCEDAVRILPPQGMLMWGDEPLFVEPGTWNGAPRPGWTAVNAMRWPQLWVRVWRPGDRIRPLGMQGHSRKLQDVWVDARIPPMSRKTWPLVVGSGGEGEVLAIPGLMVAEEGRSQMGEPVHYLRWKSPPIVDPGDAES